jgi:glycine C-acetyltransferase
MYDGLRSHLQHELAALERSGLAAVERIIASRQGPEITLQDGRRVVNFCANDYLGLASDPRVIAAAKRGLDERGYGMGSVRFVCGTQDIHKELERGLARFLGMDDALLYSSCFDANCGLFEALLQEEDAIITDALNHASIVDGIRASKAKRLIYAHADMQDLEAKLEEARDARFRLISTDGAFSMDGDIAKLDAICQLAESHDALVMVDDSHCTGFVGATGRGSHEHRGVTGRVDIITSTLGKALGGACGGFTAARKEIVDLLRNRSRPYRFSNTVPPSIVAATLEVLTILGATTDLRDQLSQNARYFRAQMTQAGLEVLSGEHPIIPILLGDAKLAADMARDLLDEGINVIGFWYPVVPKGRARIRVQVSASHTREHLDRAVAAFCRVGQRHGVASSLRPRS